MTFEGTNLLGDDFKSYVRDQIIQRQERLGNPTKTNQDIDWMNSKTSYVRLASSIDIRNTVSTLKTPYTLEELENDIPSPPGDTTGGASGNYGGTNPAVIRRNLAIANKIGDIYKTTTVPHKIFGENVGDYRRRKLDLPENFMGNELAKFLVLHGGAEKAAINGDELELQKRYGLITDYSDFGNELKAYGFQNKDWGFVGMPGIESVDIKSRSMGSIREAKVSLRVNSAAQLSMIDALYLKLGYSMFLEWGNTSHYNNDGDYQKGADIDYSLLFDFLEPTGDIKENPIEFIKLIEKQRERSNGNYDALIGKVTNFDWEFNPSGFYTATLTIISWGDIIESLKIDGYHPNVKTKEELEDDSALPVTSRENESALNQFIYEATLPSNTEFSIGPVSFDSFKPTKKSIIPSLDYEAYFKRLGQTFQYAGSTNAELVNNDYSAILDYSRAETNSSGSIISGWGLFGAESTPYYYLRFGDLLDFIKDKLIIYSGENLQNPIIEINTDPDKNYCFNPGTNVSADPSKVMIRRYPAGGILIAESFWESIQNKIGSGDLKLKKTALTYNHPIFQGEMSGADGAVDVNLEEFDTEFNGTIAGNIMNIYFEKEYLYSTIDNLRDKTTGKIPLYQFIKELLSTANSCLGGVNNLDLRIKDDQTLEIYDQNPLYGTKAFEVGEDDYTSPAILQVYGVGHSTKGRMGDPFTSISYKAGSFVTNFGIKTEITNALATTIAIGAQANNEVVGEDATAFSKFNYGLVDRIYPEKVDSRKKAKNTDEDYELEELESLTLKWLIFMGQYQTQYLVTDDSFAKAAGKTLATFFSGGGVGAGDDRTVYAFPYLNPSQYSSFVKLQQDYFKAYLKYYSKQKNEPTNQMGMIPINVNLEMDGISGIRIYDQLHIDTRFLPDHYTRSLVFIIKGVSHSFKGNRWVTSIDTVAQPKVMFSLFTPDISTTPTTQGETVTNEQDPPSGEVDTLPATQTLPEDIFYYPPITPLFTRDYVSGGVDDHGSGAYGAARGSRFHKGIDIYAQPGEKIYASIGGIARATGPYTNPSDKQKIINTGVKIIGTGDYSGITMYYFYVKPEKGLIGSELLPGAVLGTMLDIRPTYPEITNHVHLQIGRSSGGNVNSEEWLRTNFIVNDGEPVPTTPIAANDPKTSKSTKAFLTLVEYLQKIFSLTDVYGKNGASLFRPFKGYINDDEAAAEATLNAWYATLPIQNIVKQMDSGPGSDREAFEEQFLLLRRRMISGQGLGLSDTTTFSPPSQPSTIIKIDSDF